LSRPADWKYICRPFETREKDEYRIANKPYRITK
jgi:hypothetical protein